MDKKIFAFIGTAALIAGIFLPLAASNSDSANLIMDGSAINWRGIVMLVLALAGAALALIGQVKHVVWPGLAALGFAGYSYSEVTQNITPLSNMVAHIVWTGWIALGVGSLLLIITGIMGWAGISPPAAPASMNNAKVLALVGGAGIIVGLFLPFGTLFGNDVSILLSGVRGSVAGQGLVVLGCAILGGVLALIGHTRYAVLPALAALVFLVWKYIELKIRFDAVAARSPELPFSETASLNILGWAVMGIGALIMLAAGAMAFKGPRPPSAV